MKRKILSLVVLISLLMSFLSGCGSKKNTLSFEDVFSLSYEDLRPDKIESFKKTLDSRKIDYTFSVNEDYNGYTLKANKTDFMGMPCCLTVLKSSAHYFPVSVHLNINLGDEEEYKDNWISILSYLEDNSYEGYTSEDLSPILDWQSPVYKVGVPAQYRDRYNTFLYLLDITPVTSEYHDYIKQAIDAYNNSHTDFQINGYDRYLYDYAYKFCTIELISEELLSQYVTVSDVIDCEEGDYLCFINIQCVGLFDDDREVLDTWLQEHKDY